MKCEVFVEFYEKNEELRHHLELDEWRQTDTIRANLQAEYAKLCFKPPYEEGLGLAFMCVVVLYTVAVGVVSSLVTVWWRG